MRAEDIKPENFLYGGPDGTVLKLCDFGLALRQPKKGKGITGIGGTAPYMAPEILAGVRSGYGKEIDVWAFGVILYLVIYGQFPYMPRGETTANSMKQAIYSDSPPISYPDTQALSAQSLVKRLLVRDVSQRATVEEVRAHPFITKASRPSSAAEMYLSLNQAKEVAEQLRDFKASASSQVALEAKLRAITAARGGVWFSESEALSPTQSETSASFRVPEHVLKGVFSFATSNKTHVKIYDEHL